MGIEFVVTLKCPLFGIGFKKREKLFLAERKYVQWNNVGLFSDQLQSLEYIQFECNVKILNFFDSKKRKAFFYENDEEEEQCLEMNEMMETIQSLREQIDKMQKEMHDICL